MKLRLSTGTPVFFIYLNKANSIYVIVIGIDRYVTKILKVINFKNNSFPEMDSCVHKEK